MFDRLQERGFEIEFRSHAEAILSIDFPEVARQLEGVLLESTIPIEEIIGSGGGEAKGMQRLRNALAAHNWRKHNFIVQRIIDGIEKESQSHEIDHVRTFDALEQLLLRSNGITKIRFLTVTLKISSGYTPMARSH